MECFTIYQPSILYHSSVLSKKCREYLSGHLFHSITFHVLRVLGVIRYQVYQKLLGKRD